MKHIFTILTFLLTVSCSSKNKVEDVAKNFLDSFYNQDLKKAINYASTETIDDIKMIIENSPEAIKPLDKSEWLNIKVQDILVDGETAYCRYIIKEDENDAAAMSETLTLIKENNQWKAQF